ncbi:hypothetical protein PanWU01x14_213370 [Parasponia andersonii]|uniref:Uncharacterized protein n=1 Tax=Parasponia andersonii TaxID=3476 RepID=A0A2P5BT55_PARAD|nr:hypothetical protein PanWU01x14_213370 [Parasponia andersonii]
MGCLPSFKYPWRFAIAIARAAIHGHVLSLEKIRTIIIITKLHYLISMVKKAHVDMTPSEIFQKLSQITTVNLYALSLELIYVIQEKRKKKKREKKPHMMLH